MQTPLLPIPLLNKLSSSEVVKNVSFHPRLASEVLPAGIATVCGRCAEPIDFLQIKTTTEHDLKMTGL